ncbi:MAG: ankyrin repeat domain-containing protein [Pseudomonadota bacterium]
MTDFIDAHTLDRTIAQLHGTSLLTFDPEKDTPKYDQRVPMLVVISLMLIGIVGITLSLIGRVDRSHSSSNTPFEETVSLTTAARSDPPAVAIPPGASASLIDAIGRDDATAVLNVLWQIDKQVINQTVSGMTPLMTAASAGNGEIVGMLLEHGADPNQRGSSQRTALQYAAEKNRIDAAVKLLDSGADINGYDNTRLTPLTMAADRDFTDLAALLVERGADVNIAHVNGWTPLIDAARNGNLALVQLLLRAGADRSAEMPDGKTARTIAAEYGHQDIARLLQ